MLLDGFKCQDCGAEKVLLILHAETRRIVCFNRELCAAIREFNQAG